MKKIFYLSAGSSAWGMGHLRRSAGLIKCLKDANILVEDVALVREKDLSPKVPVIVSEYGAFVSGLHQLKKPVCDGIVVDVPTALQADVLIWLKWAGLPVVGIDWYHETFSAFVSLINLRGGVEPLKFALIRRDFLKLSVNKADEKVYDAVVVLGGSDQKGYSKRLLDIFKESVSCQGKEIILVVGPLADSRLQGMNGEKYGPVTILRDPPDLPDLMAKAKVGVVNGGTSLMEFSVLGVPTIIFPQTQEESDFVRVFIKDGGSVLGVLDPKTLCEQLLCLWHDKDFWEKQSVKAKGLIDGKGSMRIVQRIKEALV